jgi:superfamily II DNA/RNA helicase
MKTIELFANSFIKSFLDENKITKLTDIQESVIPEIMKGKSVNVIAKTGSGKTLAFLLPTIELIKNYELNLGVRNKATDRGKPLAIILAPTRELCMQLNKVTKSVAHHAKLRVRSSLGGTGTKTKETKHEFVEILIATPGRLASSIKRSEIDLSEVRYIIMDEADQLLELGFKKDLESIYQACDASLAKVELFSATYSDSLKSFIDSVFSDIEFFDYNVQDKNKLSRSVRTFNIYLKDDEKVKMTVAFLKNEAKGRGFIFVNKHENVDSLVLELRKQIPKTTFHSLHGNMEAGDRKKAYDNYIKSGGILVCTDVMARGIDIVDLNWVLNYDLPFEAVYYIHRCGRVGRNLKDGFAYNLVTPKDATIIARINEAIKNQTALVLTSFDENKFKTQKIKQAKLEKVTKIEKKKKVLEDLKAKITKSKASLKGGKKPFKKHVKYVKPSTTPRYKSKGKASGAKGRSK